MSATQQPGQSPSPLVLSEYVERASEAVNILGVDERLITIATHLGAFQKGLFGVPTIITSARDSLHVEGSKHARGQAIDIRTKDKTDDDVSLLCQIIRRMGPTFHVSYFDESMIPGSEHIHLETY